MPCFLLMPRSRRHPKIPGPGVDDAEVVRARIAPLSLETVQKLKKEVPVGLSYVS
jgi:hypothetical protein